MERGLSGNDDLGACVCLSKRGACEGQRKARGNMQRVTEWSVRYFARSVGWGGCVAGG